MWGSRYSLFRSGTFLKQNESNQSLGQMKLLGKSKTAGGHLAYAAMAVSNRTQFSVNQQSDARCIPWEVSGRWIISWYLKKGKFCKEEITRERFCFCFSIHLLVSFQDLSSSNARNVHHQLLQPNRLYIKVEGMKIRRTELLRAWWLRQGRVSEHE